MRTLLRFLICLGLLFVALPGGVALAAPVPDDVNSLARIQISAFTVQVLLGMVVPLVVGLLTKITLSSGVKAIIMLLLNAVQTFVVQSTMADGTAVFDKSAFLAWALATGMSVATYLGVYKPLKLTSSTPDGKLGPNTGVG